MPIHNLSLVIAQFFVSVIFSDRLLLLTTKSIMHVLGTVLFFVLIFLIYILYKYIQKTRILQAKEEHLRAILESTADLKFLVSKEGVYLDFHANDSSHLIVPPDKIIGNTMKNLFPELNGEMQGCIDKAIAENVMQEMNYSMQVLGENKYYKAIFHRCNADEVMIVVQNITTGTVTEQRLNRSEELYRGIIESQNEIIVRIDNDGLFTFVNNAYCEFMGKSKDELLGTSFKPFVHEDDIEQTLEDLANLKNAPHRKTSEHRGKSKQGWRWLAWEDSAIFDTSGNIIEIQSVGRDITEYKKTIAALEESQQLNEAVIQFSPLSISINRPDGSRITSNKAWEDLWGLEGKQLKQFFNNEKSKHIFDAKFSQLGEWREKVENVYTHGGQVYIPEIKFNYEGINSIWVSQYFYSIFDNLGNVSKVIVISEDISEIKKKEQALQEINQLHQAVSDNSPIGITVRNRYGQLLSTNKAWQDFWEYSDKELEEDFNRERSSLVFDDQETYFRYLGDWKDKIIKIYTEGGQLHIPELVRRRKNKQIQYASTYFYAIKNALGEVDRVVILTEDITSKKESILALERSEKLSRTVIDRSPLGITIRDKHGRLITYNEAWKNIWLLSDEDIKENLNRPNDTIIFNKEDDYLGEWQEEVRNIYKNSGQLYIPNLKTKKLNGQEHWVSLYIYSIDNKDGEVEMVVNVTDDITRQRESTLALEKSELLNRTVIDQSPIGITIRNSDGLLLTYNNAWLNIWQFSEQQQIDLVKTPNVLDFAGRSEYLQEWHEDIDNIYKHGGRLRIPTLKVVDFNNHTRWLSHYIYSIENSAGEVDLIVNLTLDVTEQFEAEIALRESEEKYRTLLENLPVGVYRSSLDMNTVSFNKATAQIYGYDSIEELENSEVKTHYVDIKEREKILKILKKEGVVENYEIQMKKKDGSVIWISTSLQAHYNESGEIDYFDSLDIDITERKKAELALIESENEYRSLFNNIPVGVYRSTIDGKVISLNPAMAKIYGYRSVEHMMSVRPENNYVNSKDRNDLMLRLERDCIIGNLEKQYKRNDSTSIWVSSNLKATKDKDGKILYFDGMDIDITERKLAELALSASEEKFRKLAENTSVGILIYQNNKLVYVNPKVLEFTGYNEEELKKIEAWDLFDVETRELMRERAVARFEGDDIPNNYEVPVITKQGDIKWALYSGALVEFDGSPALIGTVVDITEEKRATLALKESEEKFRTLAENASVAIVILQENKIVYMNPNSVKLTGYTEEDILKHGPWVVFSPEVKEVMLERSIKRIKGEIVPNNYEVPIKAKNGEEKWVFYSSSLIEYNGKPAILSSSVDITGMKKVQEELSRVESEKYNQVKEIAGGVAHEIYNSLFPAVTSLEKLKERLKLTTEEDTKRNKKLLGLTDTAIHRAIKMTELVTEFSKLKREDVIDNINLTEFFDNYLLEHEAMFAHIKISSHLPQGGNVAISKLHLHSLIHNLMLNAKDALEEEDKPQIHIECLIINRKVKISVSDNGSGVPKEIEKKIFDSFFSTKPRTGTGLGLAICKKIVSIYDGEISCNPSVDNGAQFSILLHTINIKDNTQV